MPNLSLLDLSENPLQIDSTRGNFFTYNNNLYIIYVEQDKKIRIKTGTNVNDIYDGTSSSEIFIVYDCYLDGTILYVAGKYGDHGFYLSYSMINSNISFTQISTVDLISHIFVINSKIHLLHRTQSSIGLSVSYQESLTTVSILSDLTAQKNGYVKDYLYDNGILYIFVQQEDDTTSYINLRVFYHQSYNATTNFNPSNSILLKTSNKNTLFSSISIISGVNCLLTIVEDYITDLSTIEQNTLFVYNMSNFITNPNYSNSLSLSGISIYSLKSIEYNNLNHLFGFCYEGSYENIKYLVVPLENNNISLNTQFLTKSSTMGYISTNGSVEILSFQNKVYVYLETRPIETSQTIPPTQIIGTTRAMISNFSYLDNVNTIVNGFISQDILNLPSGSIFDFIDPQLDVDISCGIYYGEGQLDLGEIGATGPRVSVQNAPLPVKFIFGSISNAQKIGLSIDDDFAMILKVVDSSSGQVLTNLSPSLMIDIYLDISSGTVVRLKANGYDAGQGTFEEEQVINGVTKYKYTSTLTKGNGAVTGNLSTPSASAGSDPHITTIFGTKYDFHPSTRKTYTLFQSKDIKVNSHFTGFKSGVFYDKVMIELKNKEKVDIDFNKKKIKGGSKLLQILEDQPLGVKYQNNTYDKTVGDFFEPKKMTKILFQGKNPMEMFIDFKTRYVHFRFPTTLPPVNQMSGLIVNEATRLE